VQYIEKSQLVADYFMSKTCNPPLQKQSTRIRSKKTISSEEKAEMYYLAQKKVPDGDICRQFCCSLDTLTACLNDVFVANQRAAGYTSVHRY
jgi:hypothetical protein